MAGWTDGWMDGWMNGAWMKNEAQTELHPRIEWRIASKR